MKISHSFLFVLLLIYSNFNYAQKGENLLNLSWEFKEQQSKTWLPAKHFDIHLDLLENKLIDDPYYGNNELKLSALESKNWEYKTSIHFSKKDLNAEHIDLVFEGLDTYASVYLNNHKLLITNNMFRTWKVDCKQYLINGYNELKILFESPLNKHTSTLSNAKYELPAANETVEKKVSPYTRKAAYQFGWDWGPRFVTCGIWKKCYFEKWSQTKLESTFVSTKNIADETANMQLEVEIYSDTTIKENTLHFMDAKHVFDLKPGLNLITTDILIENPILWYPNGYGTPHLYQEIIAIKLGNQKTYYDTINFGIRTIELINEADNIGTSFYFKVNEEPIYAKGANYIPQDLFLNRVKKEQYETLIDQALEANFNMLRVWGGGIYERDYFYELCDKKGILVWQDFMFANSMYPNDSSFRENVKKEVTDNIKRLRQHPSIALWCGNNEIEVAWGNWGWQKKYNYSTQDSTEIWNTYTSIFHELIPSLIQHCDKSRDYVPTTPLSNWGKAENFNHSSMHYWGVWHGREPIENFSKNVGRFIAEYGYQSFPSYTTLKTVMKDEDMDLSSEIMKNRQKSYIGNGIITDNVLKYCYYEPDFQKWVELSQLVQAHAMGYAIRQHRVQTPHCMGTLFWQLNDCWPGPSWSVIDYYGNKKAAYNEVKRYYKPIVCSITNTSSNASIIIVSDNKETTTTSINIRIKNAKNKTYKTFTFTESLSFLSPIEHTIIIPKKVRKKLLGHKKGTCIEVSITKGNELLFTDDFYLNHNSTVNFDQR